MLHQKWLGIPILVCMDMTIKSIVFNQMGNLWLHFEITISCISIDEDSEYIEEDREVEIERTKKAARRIQQSIIQELRTMIGDAQTLLENTAKDIILQASVMFLHQKQTINLDLSKTK